MSRNINKNGFIQINIIVRDIETAAKKWAQLFGVEKPEIRPMLLEGEDNYTYRGEPVPAKSSSP